MENYLILIASWALYFFIHSALASNNAKRLFKNVLGRNFYYFRLAYSFISVLGLFLLLLFNASIASDNFIVSKGLIRYMSFLSAAFGVIVIRLAFREYDLGSFIGLRNESSELKVTGVLSKIRHPIYAGTILIVIGYFFFTPNLPTLISVACIFCYLATGIWLEERKLVQRFGDQYRKYKKEVPMLFPRLW
jgi:methanethiol S-methyltransferase